MLADEQSPTINPHMAVWLDYYLHGLLNGGLALCGTYLSLDVGSARSVETSAQAWGRQFDVDPAFFLDPPAEPEEGVEADTSDDGEEEEDLEDEQEPEEELYGGEE